MRSDRPSLRDAIHAALNELGVPQPGYPAPVANAVEILRAALSSEAGSDAPPSGNEAEQVERLGFWLHTHYPGWIHEKLETGLLTNRWRAYAKTLYGLGVRIPGLVMAGRAAPEEQANPSIDNDTALTRHARWVATELLRVHPRRDERTENSIEQEAAFVLRRLGDAVARVSRGPEVENEPFEHQILVRDFVKGLKERARRGDFGEWKRLDLVRLRDAVEELLGIPGSRGGRRSAGASP